MAKITLDSVISGFKSVTRLVSNFSKIEDSLNNDVLWRDNPEGEPNQMEDDLDMNTNRITNLPSPVNDTDAVRWVDVKDGVSGVNEVVPSQSGNEKVALTTNGTSLVFGAVDSDNVDFLQAGTGAVATDVQSKLRETVSVKDFGAVGDGVTDDTVAIQAAVDYLRANGGGKLTAPAEGGVENYPAKPNRYLISSTIKIDIEGVIIDCDGTFGPYGTFTGYLFEFTQSRNLTDSSQSGNQFFDGSIWIFPKTLTIDSLVLDGRSPDLSVRQSKLVKISRISHGSFSNITCLYGIENCVWLETVVESDFYNLTLKLCGKSSTLSSDAPLYIYNELVNSWDATNNLRFYGLNIVYPAGAMMYVDSQTLVNGGAGPSINKIRNLFFYGAQFHHMDVDIVGDEGSGQSNNPASGGIHSPAAAGLVQDDTSLEFRQAQNIHFIGGNIRLGMTSNGTLIKCGDLSTSSPVNDISFTHCRLSGGGVSATCLDLDFVQIAAGPAAKVLGGEILFSGASATIVAGDSDRLILDTFGTLNNTSFGATTDSVIQSSMYGESYPRFNFRADGQLSLGDGSVATDTTLRRNGTGLMVCDGKLGGEGGLIVGNTSTTSPDITGTAKSRKMEIFGAGGGSLGFIQVYAG